MRTISTLKAIGLTERQAKVYLACLESGTLSIQELSRKLQIARSSCEATLEQLHKKGFISVYKHKTVRRYSPEDPRNLARLEGEKNRLLQNTLPELLGSYLKNKTIPTVRMYPGKDGMNTVLEEILSEADALCGFGSVDDLYNMLGDTFPNFTKRRIQKKIPVKIVLKDTLKARQRQRLGSQELREVRLIRDVGDFTNLLFMWKSKIALFSFGNESIVVVLESKDLAIGQRAMFDFIWNTLPAYKT